MSLGAETTAVAPTVAVCHASMIFLGWSMMSANGARMMVDMTDKTPNKLAAPMFSPLGLFIESLENIFLAVKAKLEVMAERKPSHVKDTSATEAMTTPATTGRSER